MTASPKELASLTGQKTDSIYKKLQRGDVDDLPEFIRLSSGPKSKIIFIEVEKWMLDRAKIARNQALRKRKRVAS